MRHASHPQQLTAEQRSKTCTGQCGESAARDTPGCGGRGREGVKANCLEAGRAPGRVSWQGRGEPNGKARGWGDGRSQWLQMSVILTLFTHNDEKQGKV